MKQYLTERRHSTPYLLWDKNKSLFVKKIRGCRVPEPVPFCGEIQKQVWLVADHQYWDAGGITRVEYLFPKINNNEDNVCILFCVWVKYSCPMH